MANQNKNRNHMDTTLNGKRTAVVMCLEVRKVMMDDVCMEITKDYAQEQYFIDLVYDMHKQQIVCIPFCETAGPRKNKEYSWNEIIQLAVSGLHDFCLLEQDKYQNAYDFLNNFGERSAEDLKKYQTVYAKKEKEQQEYLDRFSRQALVNRIYHLNEGLL